MHTYFVAFAFLVRVLRSCCLANVCLAFFLLTSSIAGAQSEIKRGLVLLLQFPDVRHDVQRDWVVQRFTGFLNKYVQEMSWGRVTLEIEVAQEWITLPDSIEHYRILPQNLKVDRARVRKLIDDALIRADSRLDLSKYAFVALMLGAKMQEYGMVGLCGYPGMLGWSDENPLRPSNGRPAPPGVAIFTSQAHPGTLFHDVAHILGGVKAGKRMVPCLYDHDLQSRPGPVMEVFAGSIINMGYWDPLSCHCYKRELPPPGISSWTRMRLGWLPESHVRVVQPGDKTVVLLGPLEDPASPIAVLRIPLAMDRYYLIENRQPIGFDQYLPGNGVLILLGDDSVRECRHGRTPVKLINANTSIPLLKGAAFDAGTNNLFVDCANKVQVQILEQVNNAFRVQVSEPKCQ